MPEIHLAYTSRSKHATSAKDLDALARQSSNNNDALGITGILLYGEGRFLQLLEGEEEAVKDLYYNKIVNDPRHEDCHVLITAPCGFHLFREWSMGRLYLQQSIASIEAAWDTLSSEIMRQNPDLQLALDPSVTCLNDFMLYCIASIRQKQSGVVDQAVVHYPSLAG
ncbi:MAG: BLUF domain-containing protein [Planctomycetota bacterium]